ISFPKGKFSVIVVKPNEGSFEEFEKKIRGKREKSFSSIQRNYKVSALLATNPPDDKFFPQQYNLGSGVGVNYSAARAIAQQQVRAKLTLCDTGITPITFNNEMVSITQLNFAGGANGVSESPHDSGNHGTGTSGMGGATSNNEIGIA